MGEGCSSECKQNCGCQEVTIGPPPPGELPRYQAPAEDECSAFYDTSTVAAVDTRFSAEAITRSTEAIAERREQEEAARNLAEEEAARATSEAEAERHHIEDSPADGEATEERRIREEAARDAEAVRSATEAAENEALAEAEAMRSAAEAAEREALAEAEAVRSAAEAAERDALAEAEAVRLAAEAAEVKGKKKNPEDKDQQRDDENRQADLNQDSAAEMNGLISDMMGDINALAESQQAQTREAEKADATKKEDNLHQKQSAWSLVKGLASS